MVGSDRGGRSGVFVLTKGIIVCFMGIDGSGKTTLAKNLQKKLDTLNVKYRYLWWLTAEKSLVRRLMRLSSKLLRFNHSNKAPAGNPSAGNIKSDNAPGNKGKPGKLMSLYQYVTLLDYTCQLFLKVWIPRKTGYVVICDRYIYDTIIAFDITFDYGEKKYDRLFDFFYRLAPKPDVFFIVDVPAEVAFSRKDDIPSVDFLKKPQARYRALAKKLNALQLDGTQSLEQLNAIVFTEIQKRIDIKP